MFSQDGSSFSMAPEATGQAAPAAGLFLLSLPTQSVRRLTCGTRAIVHLCGHVRCGLLPSVASSPHLPWPCPRNPRSNARSWRRDGARGRGVGGLSRVQERARGIDEWWWGNQDGPPATGIRSSVGTGSSRSTASLQPLPPRIRLGTQGCVKHKEALYLQQDKAAALALVQSDLYP